MHNTTGAHNTAGAHNTTGAHITAGACNTPELCYAPSDDFQPPAPYTEDDLFEGKAGSLISYGRKDIKAFPHNLKWGVLSPKLFFHAMVGDQERSR